VRVPFSLFPQPPSDCRHLPYPPSINSTSSDFRSERDVECGGGGTFAGRLIRPSCPRQTRTHLNAFPQAILDSATELSPEGEAPVISIETDTSCAPAPLLLLFYSPFALLRITAHDTHFFLYRQYLLSTTDGFTTTVEKKL
jgi:hypothetical protein